MVIRYGIFQTVLLSLLSISAACLSSIFEENFIISLVLRYTVLEAHSMDALENADDVVSGH